WAGRYTRGQLGPQVPDEHVDRYFPPDGDALVFRRDLRRCIIFGEHDLIQAPPISRLAPITCRNSLISYTPAGQGRVLAEFNFALRPDGFLVVGRAEALAARTDLLRPFDLARRIYVPNLDGAMPGPPPDPRTDQREDGSMSRGREELAYKAFD